MKILELIISDVSTWRFNMDFQGKKNIHWLNNKYSLYDITHHHSFYIVGRITYDVN